MKNLTAMIMAAAVLLPGGSAWAVTIDGKFEDWAGIGVACSDPVNSPLIDSANDYEYRGLGSLDFSVLFGTPLKDSMDVPPLPDGPYAESSPGPENELDVEHVQHALENGTLFIRAKLAPDASFDVADMGPTPPSAISATEPFGQVFEQSFYDILIDVDPGSGQGFTNDFTFTGTGPKHFSALDGAEYLVEITDTLVQGYSIYQLYRYTGDGSSFDWDWVAEVQGAMDAAANSVEIAVPLSLLQVTPVCNGKIGYSMATSDTEDWWGDDLVPGYLGETGASYWYANPPADWWLAGLPPGLDPASVIEPKRYIQIAFDGPEYCPVVACPRTQGYWWRQATSLSLIPGQGSREKRIHPDWTREELLALFSAVDPKLAFSGQTTAQALWADPALSMREKSLKQFATLLLNVESGFLSSSVPVDLGAWGLGEKTVGDVISLLQAKWLEGMYTFVNAIADSINTGRAIDLSAGCSAR